MNTGVETGAKPRLFYGWWIVAASFAIVAYGTGASDYMSSQLPDLVRQLGGSASQLGMALGISGLAGSISLLAIGPLIDRFGPRKLMLIGIPLTGIGLLWLSSVNSILTLSVLQATLVAVGMSAGFLLPVQTATANWFLKRRSLALTVICMASVLGAGLTDIFGEQIAGRFSWQGTFLGLGAVMLVICIPLALVIRHRPEPYGYLPDGELSATEEPGIDFTLKQALKTRTFWLLTVAMALASVTGTIARAYRVFFSIDQGFSHATTVSVFNYTTLMGLVGIFLFGYLGDIFPKRYLLAIAVVLQSISVVILMTTGSIAHLYLYMLAYGLGSGTMPLILAIRADYFGRKAFATITVAMTFISNIIGMPLSAGLVLLSSWIFDTTGSFQFAFLLSMVTGFATATVFFLARPPKPPQPVFTPADS